MAKVELLQEEAHPLSIAPKLDGIEGGWTWHGFVHDTETEAETPQGPLTSLLHQMGLNAEHTYVALSSEEPDRPPTAAHSSHADPWQQTEPWRSTMIIRRMRVIQ